MLTYYHSPLSMFDELFRGFDGTRRASRNPAFNALRPTGPRTNLYEADEVYRIVAEVPGMKGEDISVSYEDGVLTVKGERKLEAPEGYELRRQERDNLAFSRSYKLPGRIDADGIEAKLDSGVLTITLPKHAETMPKTITVTS